MQYIADMQATAPILDEANNPVSAEIARRIRSARARAGFTRKQLSAASGASERYLAHLEAGTGNPSVEMLSAISNALGIAMADILPLGGECDPQVAKAARFLRRMSPEQLERAVAWLGDVPEVLGGKGRRIALVGLRGAGKSSLGSALAESMEVPFFEISKEIELRYGGSIGVLLEINGPAVLRRYEAEVLEDLCRQHPAAVIAAPGAIVSDGKLYEQLRNSAWTIWLRASPDDHMQRVIAQGDLRPMTGNRSAMNDLKAILAAREGEYAKADAQIDTSAQDFAKTLEILDRIAVELEI